MDTQKLIAKCIKGDSKAQKELYDCYASTMLGICFRYTQSLSDAEDLLQEGFVRVFKHLHQYKGTGELGAWIRRIIVNTIINEIKRSKIQLVSEDLIEDGMHPVSTDDPLYDLSVKEIVLLIQRLPKGYRLIFNLHAIEGYSYAEIAELMEIKQVTVRSQYLKARTLLKRYLATAHLERKKSVANG